MKKRYLILITVDSEDDIQHIKPFEGLHVFVTADKSFHYWDKETQEWNETSSGSGGGSISGNISNGLEIKDDESIGLGGMITEDYISIADKNDYSIIQFEQDENNEQELNLTAQYFDGEGQTYISNLELRSRDDYARTRLWVNTANGDNITFELHTDNGAQISDNLFQKGLSDNDDYSENKTEFSYVTKKMLGSSRTIHGNEMFVTNGTDTRFTVIHNSAEPYTVRITPKTSFAAGPYYIEHGGEGTFDIVYITPPAATTGEDRLIIDYEIVEL